MYNIRLSNNLISNTNEYQKLIKSNLSYFKIFISTASGPRFCTSAGFDTLIKQHISSTNTEIWLVGGSTGAFRSIAIISSLITDVDMTKVLLDHYCKMYYKYGDLPSTLAPMMKQLFDRIAPDDIVDEILSHDMIRLGVFVCKIRKLWWLEYIPSIIIKLLIITNPFLKNMIFDRYFFYTTSTTTATAIPDCFLKQYNCVELTRNNFKQVLHATSAIPFIQEDCTFIDGVGGGLFLDAAFTDFMLNFKLDSDYPGLAISDYPTSEAIRSIYDITHSSSSIIPEEYYDHCTIIHPSQEFKDNLPDKQLPSVIDWFSSEYIANPAKRCENWRAAYSLSVETYPNEIVSSIERSGSSSGVSGSSNITSNSISTSTATTNTNLTTLD